MEGDDKMAKNSVNLLAKVGSWAFIVGVIIALIVGVFSTANVVTTSVLIVLGLIVGFLNVTGRETTPFLLAAVSLVIISNFGGDVFSTMNSAFGNTLTSVLGAMMTFVIPATIIVALKAIYDLAQDE
jgi:hypothetical protein